MPTIETEQEKVIVLSREDGTTALSVAQSQPVVMQSTGVVNIPLPGAGGDLTYTHQQDAASATWNVTHNLGKKPSVTVVTLQDVVVIGDVTYTDLDHLVLAFSAPFSGKAYMN